MWLSGYSIIPLQRHYEVIGALRTALRTIIFREIEMFASGIRCVRNLEDGHAVRHSTVGLAFITNGIIVSSRGIAYKKPNGLARIHGSLLVCKSPAFRLQAKDCPLGKDEMYQ